VQAKLENNELVIHIPMEKPKPSSSGHAETSMNPTLNSPHNCNLHLTASALIGEKESTNIFRNSSPFPNKSHHSARH